MKNDIKGKKIRKLLLINSDQEMQKKIRKKNSVLINSMTPLELENSFQLYKDIINTTVSTYTNVLEKHIVEQVVDIHKNINYYYSDFIEDRNRIIAIKKYNKYKGVYSAKNFDTNFGDLICDEEESEENEEDDKEEDLIKSIIPFINKKKSVASGKIIKDKSYSLISPGNNLNSIINSNLNSNLNSNNICTTCDCNSNDHQKCKKKKKRKKMLAMNYKLIYYCYTNLKRKRPIIAQNNDDINVTIYGLEIEEEYFNKMKKRASTVKKKKIRNKLKINNNRIRPKSSKNLDDSMKKEEKKNKEIKHINKKDRRECVTSKNNYNHNHLNNFTNALTNLKSKLEKCMNIRSDKKSKMRKNRLSQDYKIDKIRKTNSLVKKHKKINSNDNKIVNVRESPFSPFQNIISKLDTKTTSFDDNSSSIDNKTRSKNIKKKDINNIIHHKSSIKKSKKDDKRRRFKYITHSKLKHHYLEEIKVRDNFNANKKKSLKEPITSHFRNSLQNKVGFNFEENKKNFFRSKELSRLSLINKTKSKSKKDCTDYEDFYYYDDEVNNKNKNKMGLCNIRDNIKDNHINSFFLKKNNTLNRGRKFSYNEYK